MRCMYIFELWFSLGLCPGVGLLGHQFSSVFLRCSSLSLHQSPSWAARPRGGAPSSPSSGPCGSHPLRRPVSMLHGHAALCTTNTQHAPAASGTQAVCRGSTGVHPSQDGDTGSPGHRPSSAPRVAGPLPPRTRLLQDKAFTPSPSPLVAECDPTCVGCTGKGPAQCRECITGYSKQSGQCEGQRVHLLHLGLPRGHAPVWVGPWGGTQLLPSRLCLSPPQTTARCSC